ncbi:aldehyde dehydrogenase family protein [Azospirillum sp. sgz302134]
MDHTRNQFQTDEAALAERVARALATARTAQAEWATRPVAERLAPIAALRRRIADEAETLLDTLSTRPGRTRAESLAAEVLPLADACRFLEREAGALLKPRRLGARGRPGWLFGVTAEVRREPFGTVLVIAPSNYPLLLAGVQVVQALVAGNAALVKPAPGCAAPMAALAHWLREAGLPEGLFVVLGESPAEAEAAIETGVDKVVLTGSAETGRRVMARLAEKLIPATMELSGNDPVFVLPGADVEFVAGALAFGLRFNGSATCIAPRRVFVTPAQMPELERVLSQRIAVLPPSPVPLPVRARLARLVEEALTKGARLIGPPPATDAPLLAPFAVADARPDMGLLSEDVFAPVLALVAVADMEEALRMAALSPYALGASIFGPETDARALALRVEAGSVTINDLIAPTADPRLPFGGRRRSGWGVTRGAEGLLEMTQVKTISVSPSRFRPHHQPMGEADEALLMAWLRVAHGNRSGGQRGAWRSLLSAMRNRFRSR